MQIAPHRKVRSGCQTCRERKIKCDEARPVCERCTVSNRLCVYRKTFYTYQVHSSPDVTGLGSLSFSPLDVRLLHHWTISTAATLGGSPPMRNIAANVFIRDSLNRPYALFLALAIASLHVAFLQPDQKTFYQEIACKYHSAALPSFRANLSTIQQEDAHIIYGCSQLIAKFASAIDSRPGRSLFIPASNNESNWISLHQGAYLIRNVNHAAIRQTPAACLAIDHLALISAPLTEDHEDALNCLSTLIQDLAEYDRSHYQEVICLIKKLFAHQNDGLSEVHSKTVLLAALAQIPPPFLSAVQKEEPRAVIVLAHFCVIFEQLNNDLFWYMKNWSHLIFEECDRRLDPSWKEYLTWPRSFLASTP